MNDRSRSYGVTVAVTAAEAHAEAARDQKVTETMLSRSLSLQCGEHAATHAKRALEEMFDSKKPEANAGEGRGSAEVVGSDGEASGLQQEEQKEEEEVEEEEGLEADDEPDAFLDLRRDLQGRSLVRLHKRAVRDGVSAADVDQAMDAADPKAGLIAVIVAVAESRALETR